MQKYVCIHGHFYQPPRENPWLEAIELQDSAFPYHDWNERITAECYAPNATARMLDDEKRIEDIVNNYEKISFNFGPTLLAWLKDKNPEIHEAIVTADRKSQERYSGHGAALAQAYNHMILPLANKRDKYTQVGWGIRDFEHRFGRKPEGMWLPETAADTESLETLAEFGIRFTVLSPYQACRARKIGSRHWRDVNGGKIDPSMPYEIRLPSGRKMGVFFYDAPVSQAVAFEKLLNDGGTFASRLMSGFSDKRDWSQLMHIATDGESYGHHHRYGEMALADAINRIEADGHARLTIYGEYLEKHPPTQEAEIHQKSAWSCSHGVERWRSNCGCNSGGRPDWNQLWRTPLREALDWLRDQLIPQYQSKAAEYLKDPWAARDDYISVILDRSDESLARFFDHHAQRAPDEADRITCLRLLEMQRHAMLMYTSCGWFFDELSGIETVQVIQYAGRALQLARDQFETDYEPGFLEILGKAKSNIAEHGNGRTVYEKFARPAIVNREKVGAHYAVSSLFEAYPKITRIYSFTFEEQDRFVLTAGKARLAMGRTKVTFEITRASDLLTYGVLHFGDHNLNGGVRFFQGPEAYQSLVEEMSDAFNRADFPQVIRLMDRHFGESYYSLKSLFRDEQRKILNQILASTREDLENRYRQITDHYTPLMRYLTNIAAPMPSALQTAADFILNIDLRREFEADHTDLNRVSALLEEGRGRNVALYKDSLGYAIKNRLERLITSFMAQPDDIESLRQLEGIAGVCQILSFDVNLWKTQNTYDKMLHAVLPEMKAKAGQGSEEALTWLRHFLALGEHLGFKVHPA